jgi:2-octaprenyl-6-methoxyphenol hydroxylase
MPPRFKLKPMAKMRRRQNKVKRVTTDIIIVGGGHAGLSLAACLGAAGLKVICLECGAARARREARFDGRTLALSFRSMQTLRQGGVARLIEKDICPILDIRVADQDSRNYLDFHHTEVGANPFGWIIENRLFNRALEERIAETTHVSMVTQATVAHLESNRPLAEVTLTDGRAFAAPLIVGADGRRSVCRGLANISSYGWDYHQTAVVCTIAHSKPHFNMAVEHFLPVGPFATLPMTRQRSSIVWTEKSASADALMQMNETDFTNRLEKKVFDYLGAIKLVGLRFSYPLTLQHAKQYTAQRLALVGDAAHGIHPIAGQGFNLGMGDIDVLTEELVNASRLGLDLGAVDVLRRYERRRKFENGNMVLMTDVLDRLFSNAVPPIQVLRRLGLGVVENWPSLRRFFMRTAMGGVDEDKIGRLAA